MKRSAGEWLRLATTGGQRPRIDVGGLSKRRRAEINQLLTEMPGGYVVGGHAAYLRDKGCSTDEICEWMRETYG